MTDRDTEARKAVLRQCAEAYERHTERYQILVWEGRIDEAQEAHDVTRLVLRAYRAEADQPVRR